MLEDGLSRVPKMFQIEIKSPARQKTPNDSSWPADTWVMDELNMCLTWLSTRSLSLSLVFFWQLMIIDKFGELSKRGWPTYCATAGFPVGADAGRSTSPSDGWITMQMRVVSFFFFETSFSAFVLCLLCQKSRPRDGGKKKKRTTTKQTHSRMWPRLLPTKNGRMGKVKNEMMTFQRFLHSTLAVLSATWPSMNFFFFFSNWPHC